MNIKLPDPLQRFQWSPQPAAFRFIRELAGGLLQSVPEAAAFADRMKAETGTRFVDWIDHIRLNRGDRRTAPLENAGFRLVSEHASCEVYANDSGVFPAVLTWDGRAEIGIRADSIADFLAANRLQRDVLGGPSALLQTSAVYASPDCTLTLVERHGTRDFEVRDLGPEHAVRRLVHAERFRTRPRELERDEDGFEAANRMIDDAIRDIGRDLAADLWFAAEREFWMRRNRAARIQRARQDRLGLGWANHDHHTYRSSRNNFKLLIATWEKLGFQCRERFYAGRDAGWGAQVMEQPVTGIVTFNDVDLTADELIGDFGHDGLEQQDRLGTVGLWCGLYGDSFLQSGLHHLAAKFDFEALTRQLAEESGAKTMPPFSDFPYLRQSFTEGERWNVCPERIERLLKMGAISGEQAAQFLARGTIGSHLENIERNDGFKGFNQAGVNDIIRATDPRKNIGA